jgi:AMP nucleosidase
MAGPLVPALCRDMQIGIEAMMILRDEGPAQHSRKLRAPDEPPFR